MEVSTPNTQILYVEDDETLSFVTRDNLEQQGYTVVHFFDGEQAIDALADLSFDLAILDIMLPKLDGFAVAAEIRKRNRAVPIIFLTAKSLKEDRLKGFTLGADDYVTKPFSIEELIFKIQVFLKRRAISGKQEISATKFGSFELDHSNLLLVGIENTRQLTQREGDLLKILLANQDKICRRSDILVSVWGTDDYFMGRSLDVFISRLRKYLQSDSTIQIENIHGVGFKFRTNVP